MAIKAARQLNHGILVGYFQYLSFGIDSHTLEDFNNRCRSILTSIFYFNFQPLNDAWADGLAQLPPMLAIGTLLLAQIPAGEQAAFEKIRMFDACKNWFK
jgi:hypothetical protein